MTYRLTQRDIDYGVRKNCTTCPVARAIQRRHATQRVEVGGTSVNIGLSSYRLPKHVISWIERFDEGQAVRPMRFELL